MGPAETADVAANCADHLCRGPLPLGSLLLAGVLLWGCAGVAGDLVRRWRRGPMLAYGETAATVLRLTLRDAVLAAALGAAGLYLLAGAVPALAAWLV